jgi:hypothetical protein
MADPEQAKMTINNFFLKVDPQGTCCLKDYNTLPSAQDLKKINALLALEGDAKLSLADLGMLGKP